MRARLAFLALAALFVAAIGVQRIATGDAKGWGVIAVAAAALAAGVVAARHPRRPG